MTLVQLGLTNLKTKLRTKFWQRKNRLRITSKIRYFKDKRLFDSPCIL